MKKIAFLLLLPLLWSACSGGKKTVDAPQPKGVRFYQSELLTHVLEKAESENKLVFVDFYTSWCLPCKMMNEDVFPDEGIGDFMNEHFISYKVDAEKGNGINLAAIFEVKVYPTLLFLNDKGRVLERKEGAAYHTELRRMGERALVKRDDF